MYNIVRILISPNRAGEVWPAMYNSIIHIYYTQYYTLYNIVLYPIHNIMCTILYVYLYPQIEQEGAGLLGDMGWIAAFCQWRFTEDKNLNTIK